MTSVQPAWLLRCSSNHQGQPSAVLTSPDLQSCLRWPQTRALSQAFQTRQSRTVISADMGLACKEPAADLKFVKDLGFRVQGEWWAPATYDPLP